MGLPWVLEDLILDPRYSPIIFIVTILSETEDDIDIQKL